jgi:AcrR family transcriptional regulator
MVNTPHDARGWRERKKAELREQIYTRSLGLFRDQGYADTSVEQITSAVGIAKGTFFNHFPTKQALLVEWYRRLSRAALAEAEERPERSCLEAILCLFRALARGASADRDLFRAKITGGDEVLLRAEQELDEALRDFIEGRLRDGLERGELNGGTDAEELTAFLLALLTGTARVWATQGCAFPLDERIENQVRFVFQSVSAAMASG